MTPVKHRTGNVATRIKAEFKLMQIVLHMLVRYTLILLRFTWHKQADPRQISMGDSHSHHSCIL